jgi:hypothetical protein
MGNARHAQALLHASLALPFLFGSTSLLLNDPGLRTALRATAPDRPLAGNWQRHARFLERTMLLALAFTRHPRTFRNFHIHLSLKAYPAKQNFSSADSRFS